MESLLRRSGRSWNGLRAQTATLILISATLQISHFLLLDLTNTDRRLLLHSRKSILEHKLRPFYTLSTDFLIEELKLIDSNTKFPQLFICLAHFIGCSNGLFFVWWFGKGISPRFCLLLSCFGQVFIDLYSAFLPFYWNFVLLRYLNGLAIGACLRAVYCLVTDWTSTKLAGWLLVHIIGARFLATGLGCALLFANRTNAVNPWRLLLLIQSMLMSFLALATLICVQESPRWLLSTGKSTKFVTTGKEFAKILDTPVLDDREFYKDEDRLIRQPKGMNRFQQLQMALCFAISFAIVLRIQYVQAFTPAYYDFLFLLGAQLFAYILCASLQRKAVNVHVGFAVVSMVACITLVLAPVSPAQSWLIQTVRFLCILHSDFLFLALFSAGPTNSMPSRKQLANFRIRTITCAQALAFLIGGPIGVMFSLSFAPINKWIDLRVKHAESGLFCALGYLLIVILQLLATCIRGSSASEGAKRSAKGPFVVIEDEEFLDKDHLHFECYPQIEDKSDGKLLRPTSLLAELKQNRQFLRQKSANEVGVEVDSDGIDIEI